MKVQVIFIEVGTPAVKSLAGFSTEKLEKDLKTVTNHFAMMQLALFVGVSADLAVDYKRESYVAKILMDGLTEELRRREEDAKRG